MLTCYFGVPGVGKSTMGTKIAQQNLRRIRQGRSPYKNVYTNFYCDGCQRITFDVLKDFKLVDALLIFDELTLDADNRKYKEFDDRIRDYLVLHRHFGVDIIYLTQSYQFVDLKIRQLTQDLWYMTKSPIPILSEFTVARRIYRNININEHTSELVLGYRFCNIIERFFTRNTHIVFRRRWYKYFDSFDEGDLATRPIYQGSPWNEHPDEDIRLLDRLLNKFKDAA